MTTRRIGLIASCSPGKRYTVPVQNPVSLRNHRDTVNERIFDLISYKFSSDSNHRRVSNRFDACSRSKILETLENFPQLDGSNESNNPASLRKSRNVIGSSKIKDA